MVLRADAHNNTEDSDMRSLPGDFHDLVQEPSLSDEVTSKSSE